MQEQLESFVKLAREKGESAEEIRKQLQEGGWRANDIAEALGEEQLIVPTPNYASNKLGQTAAPIAVVENLSPRGFEYKLFCVSLVLALMGLLILANILVSGTDSMSVAAFPVTLLIVAAPVSLFLFLRLRWAEAATPELRHDASRRKVVQAIQLITFITVIIHTIVLLYLVISGHYAEGQQASTAYYDAVDTSSKPNLVADILRWLITAVIAGGVFAYYWMDERRKA